MQQELPDFTHLPLWLFLKAHAYVLYQFSFGVLMLIISFLLEAADAPFIAALFSVFAAVSLVIAAANFLGLVIRWKGLQKHNFAVVGKVLEATPAVDNPDYYLYKVEFNDPEGTRREGLLISESWEASTFTTGDKIKLLYDPLHPQNPTNYSAYESFQKAFPMPKKLRSLLKSGS